MNTQIVDQEARDLARAALALIRSHEELCAERQVNILAGLSDLKTGVAGLFTRFWVAAVSLITILLSVSGSLIYLILSKPH